MRTHPESTSVAIIGAGLIGSSVAMHLSEKRPETHITVIDLDLDGIYSSSELNAGGIRAIWNNPVNTKLSRLSIEYYERFAHEVGFKQRGYFWMHSHENWPRIQSMIAANHELKKVPIEYLTPKEISQRHPFIDKTADLGGATFTPKDGLINPNLLKNHYRQIARRHGVKFIDRVWVQKVEPVKNGFNLLGTRVQRSIEDEALLQVLCTQNAAGEKFELHCETLVNCCGPWASDLSKLSGQRCQPVRRQVAVFDCRDVDLSPYGMFVDSTGVYFHPEAGNIISGFANHDEASGYNFNYDGDLFFQELVWPALHERSTKFENLKHLTGWAGLYEISPDQTAVIGSVPGHSNFFEAHSFSGHGAMQSYAAGLGLAELISSGRFETIDLSALSCERFVTGKLISEGMVI